MLTCLYSTPIRRPIVQPAVQPYDVWVSWRIYRMKRCQWARELTARWDHWHQKGWRPRRYLHTPGGEVGREATYWCCDVCPPLSPFPFPLPLLVISPFIIKAELAYTTSLCSLYTRQVPLYLRSRDMHLFEGNKQFIVIVHIHRIHLLPSTAHHILFLLYIFIIFVLTLILILVLCRYS